MVLNLVGFDHVTNNYKNWLDYETMAFQLMN